MRHILIISHRRTHAQCPRAHTHLQHFTLTDKQHTWTPTRHGESIVWTLARYFSAPLQCLYHSASSALPTSIIPHTIAPKVNACMYKASHIGDTIARRVCAHSCRNERITKKLEKTSVCACVCPLAEQISSCQELSGAGKPSWTIWLFLVDMGQIPHRHCMPEQCGEIHKVLHYSCPLNVA